MKKCLIILLAAVLLCGCSAPDQTVPETTIQEETTMETTLPPETAPTPYDEMVARSLLSLGNPTRIQKAIDKARAGEDITIAYIGGSITEGPDVKPAERYVTLSYHEFEDTYCAGGSVTCVNAGLSGTPSNLGCIRLQRDVLDHTPDIVFVEFAVNDSQDIMQKQYFESMLRTILLEPQEPAVILIFNRTQDGYTCQSVMGLTGRHYDLPMISVTNAITEELDSGRMTWRDYSDDTVHPNPDGHRMTADFIANLFRLADEAERTEYTVPESAHIKAPFMNAVMITPDMDDFGAVENLELGAFCFLRGGRTGFPYQWRGEGEEPLTFTVTGNAVFLICNRNKTDNMGSADIYVNGEKATVIITRDSGGWGDPYVYMIAKEKTVQTFKVEVYPNGDGLFEIYGIAYTQNNG